MSSTRAEDLAARFEDKREECENKARLAITVERSCFWGGQEQAFADARDMARAGAAGGAELRAAAVRMLCHYGHSSPAAEAAWNALEKAVRATPAAPPPPAQQGEKQRRDEDGFVCEYDPGCKPETDTYTICWDGGARWLIVDRHGLITAGQSPADDRPVQQTTWQALMSPPPAQQGSSSVRDIGIVGPVNGMNEPDLSGAYMRLVLTRGEIREERLISIGAAEVFVAEALGSLHGPDAQQGSSLPLTEDETVGELERLKDLLFRFREFVIERATQWDISKGPCNHHNPIWVEIAEALATARDGGTGAADHDES